VRESVSATIVISGAVILFSCLGLLSNAAIQVQPSLDGRLEASLTQAKVNGKALVVKLTLKNVSNDILEPEIFLKDCYVASDEGRQRYHPLQDARGIVLAGPRSPDGDGDILRKKIQAGERINFWVHFPAPPPTAKTVDLFVPGLPPFEGVAFRRER